MNTTPNAAPTLAPEQKPNPGTLRSVDQRLKGVLVVNANIMNDATASDRDKAAAQDRFDRTLWQRGMIESLEAGKVFGVTGEGATWEQATEQASNLSAAEAATRLDAWMQEVLGDPCQGEDPANAIFRGHAEDLLNKLIDEASRIPA
ncbi:MAG TPA: hypothetical protein VJP80_06675 [Candidatus Saccharimonadales bacterium]|nr:hypothetical protein [Candidatus Saccharimonadales bacterium]